MKKTIYLLLTVFVLALSWQSMAQIVPIGSGTSTQMQPLANWYGFERTADLYLADEINTDGTISALIWEVEAIGATHPIKIYLATTSSSTLSISTYDGLQDAFDTTLVYDGEIEGTTTPGLVSIQLTTPYLYDGSQNLMVIVENNFGGGGSPELSNDTKVTYTSGQTDKHIFWRADHSAPTGDGTLNGNRSNIQLDFSPPPTCLPPTDLVVSNVSLSTANVAWSAATDDQEEWEVKYGEVGFDPLTEGIVIVINEDAEAALENLEASSSYDVYVRAICDEEDASVWAGPKNFLTLCDSVTALPYTEDFDTYGTGAEAYPSCWTRVSYVTGSNIWPSIVSYSTSPSSPNSLRFQSEVDVPTYAVSPAFAEDIRDLRVTFMLRRESTNSGTIDVGVMSDPNDTSTFELVETIDQDTSVWEEFVFDLDQVTTSGTDNHIAFRHNSNSSVYYYWLDDFEVDYSPSCIEPTALTEIGTTNTTVDVAWTVGATETSWNISWGTSGYTPGDSDEVDTATVTANAYQITDLNGETAYDIYIQSDCGEDGLSVWVGPLEVYTGYCQPTTTGNSAHINSFTALGDIGQNISNLNTGEGLNGNGYSDYSDQIVEVSGNGDVEVSIEISGTSTSGLKIWVDWDNDLIFDEENGELVHETSNYSNNHTVTFTVPTNEPGSYRMRVGSSFIPSGGPDNACSHSNQGEFEDYTITVVSVSCVRPTDLIVSGVTLDSAELTWTAGDEETEWEVLYGETGFDLETEGTLIVVSEDAEVTLENLESSTSYEVYVRAICDEENESAWTDSEGFSTLCSTVTLPWEEGFESGTAGQNIIPGLLCWSEEFVNQEESWRFVSANGNSTITPRNGSLMAEFRVAAFSQPATKLVTPPMDLTAISNAELTFYFANVAWGDDIDHLRVYYKKSASDEDWTLIEGAEYTTEHSDWEKVELTLPEATAAADYQIAFEATAGYARGLNLDDISVTGNPVVVCEAVTDVAVSDITETTATVTWAASETAAEGYVVEVYESGSEELLSSLDVELTETSVEFEELTPDTTYDVYVISQCDEDTVEVSEVVSFTTEATAGIGDFNTIKLTVYPNPTSTELNLLSDKTIEEVQVINILGQKVMSRKYNSAEITLDVVSLPTATYMLKVKVDGAVKTVKFIKN